MPASFDRQAASYVDLEPRHVEVGRLAQVSVGAELTLLVGDELGAAVLLGRVLRQRVDRAALVLRGLDRELRVGGACVVGRTAANAGPGEAPDLARPAAAEGNAEDEPLRRHDAVRVGALGGCAEGVVGDEPAVPALGAGRFLRHILRDFALGDEEDLGEVSGPLHGQPGRRAARPTAARCAGARRSGRSPGRCRCRSRRCGSRRRCRCWPLCSRRAWA
mmetsp:Transcript_79209/g.222064  ORF Transcript_79209/g.222064 Transcript_79209/m.222064 type:complete len:219 (+) Transcript_79209:189-845(+)